MMEERCGCAYDHPWHIFCPLARTWEAQMAVAIAKKNWVELRRVGELLRNHRAWQLMTEEG